MQSKAGECSSVNSAREALLQWTADTLALDIRSIKQVQNGAVYCQLFHALHGDAIDIAQVNFAAQSEYECLANYRLLQKAHRDMTRSKLMDWWKIVSDEEKAWELLAAMSNAVKEAGVLDTYCPLAAKVNSKGRKLPAPLEPYMVQAPLTPVPKGPSRKRSLEAEAYYCGSQPLSPKAPQGFPLAQNEEPPASGQAKKAMLEGTPGDEATAPEARVPPSSSPPAGVAANAGDSTGEQPKQPSVPKPVFKSFTWKFLTPTAGEAAEKPLDDKAASAVTAMQHGAAQAKAGNKVVEQLGQPNPINGTVGNGEIPNDSLNRKPEQSSRGVEAPERPRAGWKYVWPILPRKPEGEQRKVESAGEPGSIGGEAQPESASVHSGSQSPFSSSGKWLFSGAPPFQDIPAPGQSRAPKPTGTTSGSCGDKHGDATPPKGLGGSALSLNHASKNAKEAASTESEADAETHLQKAKSPSEETSSPRGLFSALRWQWPSGGRGTEASTETAKCMQPATKPTRRPKIMIVRVGPSGVHAEELDSMPELPAAKPQMVDAGTQTEAAVQPSVRKLWGLAHPGTKEVQPITQGRIVAPAGDDEEEDRNWSQDVAPPQPQPRPWFSWGRPAVQVSRAEVACGPASSIPENIRKAQLQDEPPEEPADALDPVTPSASRTGGKGAPALGGKLTGVADDPDGAELPPEPLGVRAAEETNEPPLDTSKKEPLQGLQHGKPTEEPADDDTANTRNAAPAGAEVDLEASAQAQDAGRGRADHLEAAAAEEVAQGPSSPEHEMQDVQEALEVAKTAQTRGEVAALLEAAQKKGSPVPLEWQETSDAADWAGVDSGDQPSAAAMPAETRQEAFPAELDTQELPEKLDPEPGLWEGKAGAQALSKPQLQAVKIGTFWLRQDELDSSTSEDEVTALGKPVGHATAEQAMSSADAPSPVEQKLQTHEEPSKGTVAAGKEQEEQPDMAAVMGFWRQKEALPGKQLAESQRTAHPPRWTKRVSFQLDDARQDGGKDNADQARFPEPAAGRWSLDANSKPENFEPAKEASTSGLLNQENEPREETWAASAASARVPGNRQVHDDSSGNGLQKKAPSAARSFWTRMLESRDQQPEAVSRADDSEKEAPKLKVQSSWAKGLTAAKGEAKDRRHAEAAAEATTSAAKPERPKVLTRLVSEKMSDADQLLGRTGVSSRLHAIRERYSGGSGLQPRSNANVSHSDITRQVSTDSALSSEASSRALERPGGDAPDASFTFRRPSRRSVQRAVEDAPQGAHQPSSSRFPILVSPFETAASGGQAPKAVMAAAGEITPAEDKQLEDKSLGSALMTDASPRAVYSTAPALKRALLKQLSAEGHSQETAAAEARKAATSPEEAAEAPVNLPLTLPSSSSITSGQALKAALLKQLSQEEPAVKSEVPRAEVEAHTQRSPSLVFSTAPALKAVLLKQLSGDENRQPPEETEPALPKVEETRELRLPIKTSGSLTSASALKLGLLKRTSTVSSIGSQPGSAESFSKLADTQRPLVQRKRLTTARSRESPLPASAVARNPSESVTSTSPTPGIGRYETATSLKNALVQHAGIDQIPASQACAPFESSGIGRFATGSTLKHALPTKQASASDKKPAAEAVRKGKAEMDPVQAAMSRAMERRASLRRNGSYKPSGPESRARVKGTPKEDNLAVRSIIKESLDTTICENSGTPPDVESQTVHAAVIQAAPAGTSLRQRFEASSQKGPAAGATPEQAAGGEGHGVHHQGLKRASKSVAASMKKSVLKNKLWVFGRSKAVVV